MQYVALFDKEKQGFSVVFPDFPECVTFGSDLDEAVDHAHEALSFFVEDMLEGGDDLPEPSAKKALMALPENKGKKAINIEVAGDGTDFEEFEVCMHRHLLERIEKYSRQHGVSPADFLADASRAALRDDLYAE